jgi:hypothetical protein
MSEQYQEYLDRLPPDAPDFGELQEVFPRNTSEKTSKGNLGGAIILMVFACGGLLIFFNLEEDADPMAGYVTLGFTAFFGGFALYFLIQSFLLRGKNVSEVGRFWLVFEGGLILLNKGELEGAYPNGKLRVFKKPKFERAGGAKKLAGQALNAALPDEFRLTDEEGNKIRMPLDKRDSESIIRPINKNLANQQLPVLLKKVVNGKPVSFGKVKVSQQGLAYDGKAIPFDEIGKLKIFVPNELDDGPKGVLRIDVESSRGGTIAHIKASKEMYNIWLFVKLVRSLNPDLIPKKKSIRELLT